MSQANVLSNTSKFSLFDDKDFLINIDLILILNIEVGMFEKTRAKGKAETAKAVQNLTANCNPSEVREKLLPILSEGQLEKGEIPYCTFLLNIRNHNG